MIETWYGIVCEVFIVQSRKLSKHFWRFLFNLVAWRKLFILVEVLMESQIFIYTRRSFSQAICLGKLKIGVCEVGGGWADVVKRLVVKIRRCLIEIFRKIIWNDNNTYLSKRNITKCEPGIKDFPSLSVPTSDWSNEKSSNVSPIWSGFYIFVVF